MREKCSSFTWTQTPREVEVRACFELPFKLKSRDVAVEIKRQYLTVGIRMSDQPHLIDGATFGKVSVEGSTWALEKSNTVVITLEKTGTSQLWFSLLKSDQCLVVESCSQILIAMPDKILLQIIRNLGVLDQSRLLSVNKRWNAHIASCLRCVTISEMDLKMQLRKYEMKKTTAEFVEGFFKSHGRRLVKLVVLTDLFRLSSEWHEWITKYCGNLHELSLRWYPMPILGSFANEFIAVSSVILKLLPKLRVLNAELLLESIAECNCFDAVLANTNNKFVVSSMVTVPGVLAALNRKSWFGRLIVRKISVVDCLETSEFRLVGKIFGLQKLHVSGKNCTSLHSTLAQLPRNMQELCMFTLGTNSGDSDICFDSVLKDLFSNVQSLVMKSCITISTLEFMKELKMLGLELSQRFHIEIFKSLPVDVPLESLRLMDSSNSECSAGNAILEVVASRGLPISVLWIEGFSVEPSVLRSVLRSISSTLKKLGLFKCGLGDEAFAIIRHHCFNNLAALALEDELLTVDGIKGFLSERQTAIARGESLSHLDLVIARVEEGVAKLEGMEVIEFSSLFDVKIYSKFDLFGEFE